MVQFNTLEISNDGSKITIDVSIKEETYFKDVYLESVTIDTQDTYISSGPSSSPVYKKSLYTDSSSWVFDPVAVFGDYYVNNGFPEWEEENTEWYWGNTPIEEDSNPFGKVFKYNNEYYKWTEPGIVFGDAFKPNGEIEFTYFTKINTEFYRPTNYPKSLHLEININEMLVSSMNNLYFIYVTTIGNPTIDTPCCMDNKVTLKLLTNLYPLYQKAVNYLKEMNEECSIPKNFIDFILRYKALQISSKTGHYIESLKYWNRLYSTNINTTSSKCGCYG